jgi:phosphatidylglycerophosphate synthase
VTVPTSEPPGLAFKAYEIEELVDVYFFRRCGIVVARAARACGLTPNVVSVLAGLIGGIGGALLASEPLALAGVVCLYLHGIFDSADGQLARMTGQTSEFGRLLDGLAGYVTHAAAYLGIAVGVVSRGGAWDIFAWAASAGVMTAIQAQMYDYHRTTYAAIAVKGVVPVAGADQPTHPPAAIAVYEEVQQALAGLHPTVEALIAGRADRGRVRDDDRARYRRWFYRPVLGWNLLGDNVRRYAFAVLAIFHHLEWMFLFILIPLNVVLAAMWLWQRRADRGFLDASR